MQKIAIRKLREPYFSGGFETIDLGNLLVDKRMEEDLHRHDFYFLLVLEDANGVHSIDFNDFPVSSNSVFPIRPGQVHRLTLEQGSKGYLITFDADFYTPSNNYRKETFRKAFLHNCYKLESFKFDTILSVSRFIFNEFTRREMGYEEIIKANLDMLFIELTRNISEKNTLPKRKEPYEQVLLEEFVQLLEREICTNKEVNEYANMLHTTPYKLNSITKNLLGKTCSQLITQQIILEAKRLLLATSNQINEVAFQLCYEDPAYFIRFFKKHTNYTPQAFRDNFR
ncbi:helix-turn-helix domain-containing protein [Arenibacter sp. M-2]|uniref:helix-turn-helix domain-containing protein n=1 Tax=Arenibacter sp. M-2 TaxID=3053612 RepID=UPI002570AD8F|nr:helix-turn-helix domain-containing protein [Arenibacter sp. M-2]MDL5511105.1 helix-turn-helix domain-containing protein [Arenibacter sp. M-2]